MTADQRPGDRGETDAPPSDLWSRLLAGELDPEDPEVRARIDADPALAERWAQMQRLTRHLDRVSDDEAAILAAVGDGTGPRLNLDLGPPPGLLEPTPSAPARSPWQLRALGAVLGLAAAAILIWLLPGDDRSRNSQPDLEALRGLLLAESDFDVHLEPGPEVRWDLDPELGWFDLAVFEIDAGVDPQDVELDSALYERRDLFDNRLELSPLPWPPSENPVWIRVTQRIAGATGEPPSGGVLLLPSDLPSSD